MCGSGGTGCGFGGEKRGTGMEAEPYQKQSAVEAWQTGQKRNTLGNSPERQAAQLRRTERGTAEGSLQKAGKGGYEAVWNGELPFAGAGGSGERGGVPQDGEDQHSGAFME